MQPLDRSGHLHVVIYRLDFLTGVIPLDLGELVSETRVRKLVSPVIPLDLSRLETYGIACLNQ